MADSYNSVPSWGYVSPKEAIPQAKTAARRALEIDPTLGEAHSALATSLAAYDWNWVEAEREFKRAIELNPNYAIAHWYYGQMCLLPTGRLDEAITEMKRSLELDPLALIVNANLGAVYVYARQYDLALEQNRKTYDLEPNFIGGQFWLIEAYIAKGMNTEAIALSQKALLQTDPPNPIFLGPLGYAYAKAGRRREAIEIVNKLEDLSKNQYVIAYRIARIYAALGQRDEAFAVLEKAYDDRDWFLPRLKVDPAFDSLHDDPRFQDLLRRVSLA
jgi:tetratricopeptide (TPR) repeat protein